MKTEKVRCGEADRFEIAIGWVRDPEPPRRRPSGYGWSMGRIELTVAGINLTASRVNKDRQPFVCWYLAPMLNWLASNWVSLLHEEHFAWPAKDAAPAAIACRRALDFWVASKDEEGRRIYAKTQEWYLRHGLRSAAAGGLFPDLFIRRIADDIELSWSGEPPPFAPEGLAFESGAGVCRLSVKDVAEPLWMALQWVRNHPPELDVSFSEDWEDLCKRIDAVEHLGAADFEAAVVSRELLSRLRASFAQIHEERLLDHRLEPGRPFVESFSPAIAMFGGLRPQLDNHDIDKLRDVLVAAEGGMDDPRLSTLVRDRRALPIGGVPHEDGYQFADDILGELEDDSAAIASEGYVDVRAICHQLGIEIKEFPFDTDSIRGVALAGQGFRPTILVNLTSEFNQSEDGRRFTIAHELCHILFDRTRARRIAHSSGPWAAPAIEKRANAFAAYFLMPREIIGRYFRTKASKDPTAVRELARRLRVSESALVEHLYNLDFIDENQRERLRSVFRLAA